MCFNDWLSRRRLYTPQRVAVVDDADGQSYRYGELDARAVRVAHHLQDTLAVQPGDRVACLSSNRVEYLDLYFACGKVGAVLVPLNLRLPQAGVIELLEDCRAKLLVYEANFAEIAAAAQHAGAVPRCLPIEANGQSSDEKSLAQVLATSDLPEPAIEVYQADESDTAMILYTSGTTGRAKGAMIPYRQIHWNALNTIIGLQLTHDDAAFLNMPLYHTGGWHVLFTPLMLLGGRVILQQRFDPVRCNELLGPQGITILFGVPTTLRMMWQAANFSAADFSRVRFAIFGGESCALPVIKAYGERGVAMRQGYGLTEAGPNCFSLPADDSIRKQGSIGFPNFHVGARLVKEDGGEAEAGEVGELWMKGPHVFAGYWDNPGETANTLRQGWLATGDLMTRDADGYYYVVGRKKDMYVSGGENVYPAHVERILQSHEAVAMAAVVGTPDPQWGETGWAFVACHADKSVGEGELLAWCKQHLATFQCPTQFVMMKELPMGPSGKTDKLALAQRARDMRKL
jgi:fatty-acyl-CoA synthase